MIKQSAVRMTVDISMSIFSLVLMGVHVVLNRRWYASLAKGAYRPFRIMQAVVN